jgi:cell wall-associated NlpC family hydrolase
MHPPAWASRYVGIPYADRGRGPVAYDCWGLVRLIMSERFSVELPSFDDLYWTDTRAARALGERVRDAALGFTCIWANTGNDVPDVSMLRPGDVLLMRVDGAPVHVGVIALGRWFLHTEVAQDSCLDSLDGFRWSRRVFGVYRHERTCERQQEP